MNNNQIPMVSVIIPVYNVEPYLRECMDSIVNQTLRDIEIICVNDGSTDGSLSILEEYRANDPRITIISQENNGLSAARNRGLNQAQGKYIYLVDSDDYVALETLKDVARLAEDHHVDAVVFGFHRVSSSGELLPHPFPGREMDEPQVLCSGVSYMKKAKDCGVFTPFVWAILWRRSFLSENALLFKEHITYEDNLFVFQAYMAAERVLSIPNKYYYYRYRPESITTKRQTAEDVESWYICAEGVLKYALQDTYPSEKENEICRSYTELAGSVWNAFNALTQEEQARVVFQRNLDNELFKQIITRYQIGVVQNKCSDLEQRINSLEQRINRLQYDLDCVHASVSFRIGRVITWLPRKIRGGVRCYKEHGMRYTVRRTFEHLTGHS